MTGKNSVLKRHNTDIIKSHKIETKYIQQFVTVIKIIFFSEFKEDILLLVLHKQIINTND